MSPKPDTLRARCERLVKKWTAPKAGGNLDCVRVLTFCADELAAALKPKKTRKRK